MKRSVTWVTALVVLALSAWVEPALACMTCDGGWCASSEWEAKTRCRTQPDGSCRLAGEFCGENSPAPFPQPKPPIQALQLYVFAAETETLGGLPSTIPGGDSASMRHEIAMVAGVPAETLHLRAASFAAAESFPGHADEALSFGDDGFLMRGGIQNGLFELTVCAFRRPDTEVQELAQSPLDSGEAFAVPVTLGSQAAVVAFRYTEIDADEFDTIGIQLQQDLWADLSQNREFPAFALAWSEAPAGCTSD